MHLQGKVAERGSATNLEVVGVNVIEDRQKHFGLHVANRQLLGLALL
jgi:hypothetical protein